MKWCWLRHNHSRHAEANRLEEARRLLSLCKHFGFDLGDVVHGENEGEDWERARDFLVACEVFGLREQVD